MNTTASDARLEAGLAAFEAVYGDTVPAPPAGMMEMFDLLILKQQFAEVWTRPALDIPDRRLLVMGVLASRNHFDTLEIQFRRALQAGELTVEQVREVVIHLVGYVGTPASGPMLGAADNAIRAHEKDLRDAPDTQDGE